MRYLGLSLAALMVALMALPAAPAGAAATSLEAETLPVSPWYSGSKYSDSSASGGNALKLWWDSRTSISASLPAASGIVVRAKSQSCGGAPTMTVKVDGMVVSATPVTASQWTDFTIPVQIKAGTHQVTVGYARDPSKSGFCAQALMLDTMSLAGVNSDIAPETKVPGHDAGLTVPFQRPDPPTGRTLSILDHGATSNDATNDDATAIQNAIGAASAGDTVYIPNGTYHVKSIILLKTGVSVAGQSRDGTVLAAAYKTSPHAVLYAAPGVNNLNLSSLTVTVASGQVFAAGVRLGQTGSGQVSRIAVKDLLVEKHQRFGIELQNAQHVLVDSNIIKNASALDGGGSGYGVLIDQSGSNNNWVTNNVIGPVIRHGILAQYKANHNLIDHNTIFGAVSSGIDMHGEDEHSNEISYNKVSDCVRNGTSVSPNGGGIEVGEFSGIAGVTFMHDNSGPNNWIHHNDVSNCTYGLRITNNSNNTFIEDNTFHDNLVSGIQADLAPLKNLYLLRNQIRDNASGVLVTNVKPAVVQENSITNNAKYGLWTNSGVTGYTITDNTVTGNGVDVVLGSQNGTFG